MRKTQRTPVLFLLALVLSLTASGCVRQQAAAPGKLPKWLTDNMTLVETSIEGTVLIDATPLEGKMHHGGIGIVLDPRHVLMPAHSVKGAKSVVVLPRSFYKELPGFVPGDEFPGKIIAVNEEWDSALFETQSDLPSTAMRIARQRRPEAKEHVWYFGKYHGFQPCTVSAQSVTAGILTDAIQVAIEAANGDSGAPLVTDDGFVVGMLHGTSVDNKRTFFVPIDKALTSVGLR